MAMTLPIHPETIHSELEQIEALVTKWRKKVGAGLPGIDLPAQDAEEKLDNFLREFTGELLFVGGKCNNMALILSER